MRPICLIFLLMVSVQTALAVRAWPYPVTVRQPDGSTVTILLHGDEYFHYATTTDGRTVSKGRDGFFYYTSYSTAGVEVSDRRVAAASILPFSLTADDAAVDKLTARHFREQNRRRLGMAGEIPVKASGSTARALIIPVEFSDVHFSVTDPRTHFDNMMNTPGYSENGGTGSVKDYFMANMPDKEFIFDVCSPVRLDHPYSYYGENDVSTPSVIRYDIRIKDMVKDACTLASNEIDFSEYDMDSDGIIDYVFIYFAGYNEAESGDDNAIWPQTYNLISYGLRFDGLNLGLFACTSELSGSDLGGDVIPSGIGTFCHEFAHFLGLVDLYDTDHGSGGMGKCLWGSLSLMDTGNYNNFGRTPPYFCAIDRELAGTALYMSVSEGMTVSLEPSSIQGTTIRIPTSTNGEYYLVENRQQTGWDSYIGGSGMLIYHIDKSENIVDGITASMRWKTNLINAYAEHECADLVEASPKAEHISQVFFPGQAEITGFSAAGTPAFIEWDGTPLGIQFSNIAMTSDAVTFDIMEDNTEILLRPTELHITAYQNKALAEWDCGRPGTYKWGLIWGDVNEPEKAVKDTAMTNRYTFENLSPKTGYFCLLYHIGEHNHGDTAAVRFSTSALTSPYPYITLDRRVYRAGDTVNLVINNLTEDISSCLWYINGTRAITDRYILRSAGEYEITAVIRYSSDGSQETIRRLLTVKEEEDIPDEY